MAPSERILSTLLGSLYDAAGTDTLWESFLGQLTQTCHGQSAALVMHHFGRKMHTISASWRIDPGASRLYQQHYGSTDVWAIRGRNKPAGCVATSESLCSPKELASTEFYNDFLKRDNVGHGLFGMFERKGPRFASVSIYRAPSSKEFRTADLNTLAFLIPHMQRAFKIHFQLSELKSRVEGTETALNMLSMAVIFMDGNARVALINRSAEELLRLKDGLLLEQGKLSASIPSESTRLQAIVSGAVQTGSGKGLSPGGTIFLSRERGRPLSVTVAPLRNNIVEFGERAAAVLFISDPEQRIEIPANVLQRCYALTAAEARITILLLEGQSLNKAAEICDVTRNTAKSQLKSVFSKIQVQRQGELIKVLLAGLGQLRVDVHTRGR